MFMANTNTTPRRKLVAGGRLPKNLSALTAARTSPSLEATLYQWNGADVAVTLERDGVDHAVVELRVLREPAPGWGYYDTVELVDVEGDGEGIDEWLAANEDEVLEHYGWSLS